MANLGTYIQVEELELEGYAESTVLREVSSTSKIIGFDQIANLESGSQAVELPAIGGKRYGYRIAKRIFDIVFSAAILLVFLIPGLILALAIRLGSKGSPIFIQERMRRNNQKTGELQTFKILKFRSMYMDSHLCLAELEHLNEATGPLFKIKDDPRITKIGKVIRKHSIDEMPQFINVFLGQMSLVGPRPPLPNEVAEYSSKAMKRLTVKPGLTGYWQTRGRSDLGFEKMVDLDLEYIRERSFFADIRVIMRTVAIVFNGNGAR